MKITNKVVACGCVSLVLLMFALTGQAQVFTTGNGYVNGMLGGQNGWVDKLNGSAFQVDTANGVVHVSTASGATALADYTEHTVDLAVGWTATASMDFSFTQAGANPASGTTVIALDLYAGGSLKIVGGFSRDNASYSLVPSLLGGSGTYVQQTIAASSIGINGTTDLNSDLLRLSVSVTYGADLNSWSTSVSLYDVTTSTFLGTATTAFTTDLETYTGSPNGWRGQLRDPANTSSVISALDIYSYNGITAVPEASSVAMLGLGLAALLGGFKMRRLRAI